MYFMMPETESKTLEDVEAFFTDDDRKLLDHNMRSSRQY